MDASVCAVMWSSHASVLRKYVTFHLWDAGRCKAAACLPGSLRAEERLKYMDGAELRQEG